jgi:hypothetical protein
MKCMVTFSISSDNIADALERFQGGAGEPPAGVTMLGRWHEMGTGDGFALFEVADQSAFTAFLMGWADLVDQHVVPVVEDETIAALL